MGLRPYIQTDPYRHCWVYQMSFHRLLLVHSQSILIHTMDNVERGNQAIPVVVNLQGEYLPDSAKGIA
jgi:hypothetical protein